MSAIKLRANKVIEVEIEDIALELSRLTNIEQAEFFDVFFNSLKMLPYGGYDSQSWHISTQINADTAEGMKKIIDYYKDNKEQEK